MLTSVSWCASDLRSTWVQCSISNYSSAKFLTRDYIKCIYSARNKRPHQAEPVQVPVMYRSLQWGPCRTCARSYNIHLVPALYWSQSNCITATASWVHNSMLSRGSSTYACVNAYVRQVPVNIRIEVLRHWAWASTQRTIYARTTSWSLPSRVRCNVCSSIWLNISERGNIQWTQE